MTPLCHTLNCNSPECRREHVCVDCNMAESQCVCVELEDGCVSCGSVVEVTTRSNNEDGESEPLCASCWYEHDHSHERRYAEIQFAFYNPKPSGLEIWQSMSELFEPPRSDYFGD